MLRQSLLIALLFFAISSFGQNVNVTATSGTANSNYTTLLAAFNAINAGTHHGYIIVTLNGNTTEVSSNVLNASGSGSCVYDSIRITSSGAYTVTGNIAAGNPLIDLNGADNVFFEGVNSGGVSLTISNTRVDNTSGTCTIRMYNDATKNRINKCNILGSSTMTTNTNGGNIFISTALSTGNDNNTISNCTIGGAGSNMPNKGIYLNGTTTSSATNNDGITISNNNFVNFNGTGIYVSTGNYGVSIANNNFYHTATQTVTDPFSAVYISNSNTGINFNVFGNNIGGSAANCGGSAMSVTGAVQFQAIYYNGQNAYPASNIYGNRIANISINTSYATTSNQAGIYIYGGRLNCGTQQGNLIGDTTTTGSIVFNNSGTTSVYFHGITTLGTTSVTGPALDTIDISNNRISGINVTTSNANYAVGLRAIYLNGTNIVNPYFTVNNNLIGSNTTANSISCSSTLNFNAIQSVFTATTVSMTHQIKNNTINNLYYGGGLTGSGAIVRAIILSGGANSFNVSNNTIKNITSTIANSSVSGGASNTPIMGINIGVTGNSTISGNQIYNLNTTAASATAGITGLLVNIGTGSLTISKNRIFALNSTSTGAAILTGMYIASGTNTVSNNEVGLGLDWVNNSLVNPYVIYGVYEASGTNNFYFNSVSIQGTGVINTSNTYAFYSSSASGTRDYRNNIFSNTRSFATAGATYNYAAFITGTPPTIAGLTCNKNLYYASGTGAMLIANNSNNYATLSAWTTVATSHDANSVSSNPNFYNNYTLKPMNSTLNGDAIAGISTDIEGITRANNRVGAYENLTSLSVNIISFEGNWIHQDPSLYLVTASESNLSLYTIERSENGNEFIKAGTIQPSNTIFQNNYNFEDISYHGTSNTLYYRVKVTELNGASYYSNTIQLTQNNSVSTTQLSPNPFHETIRLTNATFVALYDVTGKNCEQMIEVSVDGTLLQTEKLPLGVYIVKYKNQEGVIESKIINKL